MTLILLLAASVLVALLVGILAKLPPVQLFAMVLVMSSAALGFFGLVLLVS